MRNNGVKGYEVYDRLGNFVQMFPTLTAAGTFCGVTREYIRQVASEEFPYSKTAKGFKVKKVMFTEEELAEIELDAANRRYHKYLFRTRGKPIVGTHMGTGETIGPFASPNEAAQYLGVKSSANICNAAATVYRDGRPMVSYGYRWDYIEEQDA